MSPCCSWRHPVTDGAIERRIGKHLLEVVAILEGRRQGPDLLGILAARGRAQAHSLEGFRDLAGSERAAVRNLLAKAGRPVAFARQIRGIVEYQSVRAPEAD